MAYQNVFSALADPTRRAVYERLAVSPSSVGTIAETLPVSRPAVSQHLKVLSDAGLVTVRAEGTRRVYSVSTDPLAALRVWLDDMWANALDSFRDAAEKENTP